MISAKYRQNLPKIAIYTIIIIFLFTALMLIVSTYKNTTDLELVDNDPVILEKTSNLSEFFFNKSDNLKSVIKIKRTQTLEKILLKKNINKEEVASVLNELSKYLDLKKIKINQAFEIVTSRKNDKENSIQRLTIQLDNINTVHLIKESDAFIIKKIEKVLYKKNHLAEGLISKSLYHSAKKSQIDDEVIVEFARVFGFEIDFQRDIRKNDIFQIVYEQYVDDDGELQKNGKIIYAYMKNDGKEFSLYYFKDKENQDGYFFPDGKSVEKALMKTPINGARLSSKFGMRKHPILGYNKMHKGTDFAAKRGTPIMASGSGVVEKASWFGAYGKYIRIRHNSKYKTAYAHLSKFGRGVRVGKKVRQGQIIGYVGSTGRSTGPHLHYEVLIRNKRVNSQRLKLPSGRILKGLDRENFEVARIKIDVMRSTLVSN
tara:strand:+ start:397 stop:1686 length:1290 start_codon:yes stop_codon:yes gene_type:complete